MKSIKSITDFLQRDIWRIQASKIKGPRSFWIKQLRIILLAIRGYDEDKCQLRASALTYYSLLSIVPVVAMAFGIAKGFGFQKTLGSLLIEKMPGQEEVVTRIIEFSYAMLENTQGGIIAGIGVLILFWTVIKVLGNIEISFNEIWGVRQSRPLVRKFSDYLSIMMICPILLIMSSSMTVLITSQVTLVISKLSFLGPVGDVIIGIMRFLPYCVMWILFSFLYIFIPNTTVRFKSALIGGIMAGTIYQIVQWGYINSQVFVAKFGAIYGSFAALPLFLIWMQISWLIVLFGAEVSFAEQNVHTYEFEPDSLKASRRFRQLIALVITQMCVKRFDLAQEPLTAEEVSIELEVPIRLANDVMFNLTEARVLMEVKKDAKNRPAYQPAHDIDDITVEHVISLMDKRGTEDIPFLENKSSTAIRRSLDNFNKLLVDSEDNLLLKDIP